MEFGLSLENNLKHAQMWFCEISGDLVPLRVSVEDDTQLLQHQALAKCL